VAIAFEKTNMKKKDLIDKAIHSADPYSLFYISKIRKQKRLEKIADFNLNLVRAL
jgi:hypothetical protein